MRACRDRRLAAHDALMIRADIEPADVITHDDKDIGFRLLLRQNGRACAARGDQCRK